MSNSVAIHCLLSHCLMAVFYMAVFYIEIVIRPLCASDDSQGNCCAFIYLMMYA